VSMARSLAFIFQSAEGFPKAKGSHPTSLSVQVLDSTRRMQLGYHELGVVDEDKGQRVVGGGISPNRLDQASFVEDGFISLEFKRVSHIRTHTVATCEIPISSLPRRDGSDASPLQTLTAPLVKKKTKGPDKDRGTCRYQAFIRVHDAGRAHDAGATPVHVPPAPHATPPVAAPGPASQRSNEAEIEALRREFPAMRDMVADVYRGSGESVEQARRTLQNLSGQAEAPATQLQQKYPGLDVGTITAVLEASGGDVTAAEAMLAAMSGPQGVSGVDKLCHEFPSIHPNTVRGVFEVMAEDVERTRAMLVGMIQEDAGVLETEEEGEEEVVELALGDKCLPPKRRLLCFFDDSGSMAGANLRVAHQLIQRLAPGLASVPTKVIIFGSKSRTRILDDWSAETSWEDIISRWKGQSGRTYLWDSLLGYVSHEDPTDLHVLLITDGEDTESQPPLCGIEGMLPTVERLNEVGFNGEIHLVAIGEEVTESIAKNYMALVGATGGAGVVLNKQSPPNATDEFVSAFMSSVAIKGAGAADNLRQDRLKHYAAQVAAGAAPVVPTKYALGIDPELAAAFERCQLRPELVRVASIERKERKRREREARGKTEVSDELRKLLAKRKEWEKGL